MCKSPVRRLKVLLVAWETPMGQEALRGNRPGSMSIEFAREVMKAYETEGTRVDFDSCKATRDRLFQGVGHPCCVIDFRDAADKEALVKRVDQLEPVSVVLLGSKVANKISALELKRLGRIVLQLGFPYGANQRRNVVLLNESGELRRLLTPHLSLEAL